MSKKELNRRLAVIWTNLNEDDPDCDRYRYVPRAIPNRDPGSHGWDIFDRKSQKFITSKKEIMSLTFDECVEKLLE